MKPTEKTKSRKFPRPGSKKEGLIFHLCLQLACVKGPSQRKLIWPAMENLRPRLGHASQTKVGIAHLLSAYSCAPSRSTPCLRLASSLLSHASAATQCTERMGELRVPPPFPNSSPSPHPSWSCSNPHMTSVVREITTLHSTSSRSF